MLGNPARIRGTFQALYFSIRSFYNRKKEGIFMNTNIISKYLQLLRKKHNYTQDELAKRLDISRQAVSKWETGTGDSRFRGSVKNIISFTELL